MTRRDNGLPATSYARLRDVETHLVEGLLDRLRDESIAAYVAPASGRRGPYGETVLPSVPSDSVYVASDRVTDARGVTETYLTEVADDIAWAGIVASYDLPSGVVVGRWPASEEIDEQRDGDEDGDVSSLPRRDDVVRPPGPGADERAPADLEPRSGYSTFSELREIVDQNEEHFTPPPPPPLPVPDTVGRFAWAAVVGGPLFLVITTLFGFDSGGWPGTFALAAFVGGFVTLVARMKDHRDDEGGDDGAIV